MQTSILLISSSSVAGSGYLHSFEETIKEFLKDIPEIVFVPYSADKSNWDTYTKKVKDRFTLLFPFSINKSVNNVKLLYF